MGGLDAEGDDPPLSGDGGGALASLAEFVGLAYDVVGRQHEHEGVAIAFGGEKGGDGHRKTRIAAHRLEHDVGLDAALAQLLGDAKAEDGTGNGARSGGKIGMRE